MQNIRRAVNNIRCNIYNRSYWAGNNINNSTAAALRLDASIPVMLKRF